MFQSRPLSRHTGGLYDSSFTKTEEHNSNFYKNGLDFGKKGNLLLLYKLTNCRALRLEKEILGGLVSCSY